MACAILICAIFFDSMYLSGFVLFNERESGVKYRDRVSGITKLEVVIADFIFSFLWVVIGAATFAHHYGHILRLD